MEIFKTFRRIYDKLLVLNKKYKLAKISSMQKSLSKYNTNSAASFSQKAQIEQFKTQADEKIKAIVKQYMKTPEKLIQYIQTQGIKVYKIKNAEKILGKFSEEEGFITPLKGFKAFSMNLIIGFLTEKKLKLGFSTKEMMIFDINNKEIYTIARALYKYYGFKHKLPGYDYKSQEVYKRVYNNRNTSSPFNGCSIKDLYACKEALSRDMESINFTVQLSIEHDNAKNALKKLKETNSINL